MTRLLSALWIALLAITLCASFARADDTAKGKVLKAGDAKITFTDSGNDEITWDVSESAKITRNGKKAGLSELEEGDVVEMTTAKKSDKTVVTAIVARSSE